jgi:hypothetical protein
VAKQRLLCVPAVYGCTCCDQVSPSCSDGAQPAASPASCCCPCSLPPSLPVFCPGPRCRWGLCWAKVGHISLKLGP